MLKSKQKIINSKKKTGEVFTPNNIVKNMLSLIGYYGNNVLKKHIIDNSAGDGAFLKEIVYTYICSAKTNYYSKEEIKSDLETYIHGIEINKNNYKKLIESINLLCKFEGIQNVKWDILNNDALQVNKFDKKMDFVVGNPPYVRVHNLESFFDNVKKYSFCKSGMTDLFISFFEIGFRMLNITGKMCYISPSSWWTSVAGNSLRKYIKINRNLKQIIDLKHHQPFDGITVYTCISLFDKKFNKDILYSSYLNSSEYIKIPYEDAFINEKLYFSSNNMKLKEILNNKEKWKISVKNGFATLNDSFFIKETFPDNVFPIIPIYKASTGKMMKCFYPYDKKGNLLRYENLNDSTKKFLKDNSINSKKYMFGRTQGLKDTYQSKIAVNTLVNDNSSSVKIKTQLKGVGVYSGLYILTDISEDRIIEALRNDLFIKFIKSLRKYKNGGFYTFNSNDLKKYLNYYFYSGKEKYE